jgi:hypothetical protein
MKTPTLFRTLLLALLVAAGNDAMAQETEYHPFADNAVWSVNNIKYATHGDTTICGRNYLKVYRQKEDHPFDFDVEQAEYFCAIRNDTAAQRVYGIYKEEADVYLFFCIGNHHYLPEYTSTHTTEFLLFDFSIETGDTITIASFEGSEIYLYNISTYDGEYIDYVNLSDNTARRAKKVVIPNGFYYPTWEYPYIEWIEGIGSTNGNFYANVDSYFEITEQPSTLLLCYEEGGALLLSFPWDYDYNYDCFFLSHGGTNEQTVGQGTIYPNPAHNTLTVESASPIREITVYDMTGHAVAVETCHGASLQQTLNTSSLPIGIYIVNVITDKGSETAKFMKN